MARGTVSVLLDRIDEELASTLRLESNWLAVSVDASETTLTMSDDLTASIRVGSILAVDRELMRVRSKNEGAKEVVVRRGWRSSPAESHDTDAEVHINPRFTRHSLYQAMIDEINSWGQQLFKVESYELEIDDETQTFELPVGLADAIGLVNLRWQRTGADIATWPDVSFRLIRGDVGTWTQATTSGLYVRVIPPTTGGLSAGTLHGLVARPFDVTTTEPTDDEDLVADFGLTPSMLEVVELGVKMRVLGDAENARSGRRTQDEPRRAEEVPPGAALTVAQTIRQNYERRFGDEIRKLQRKWKVQSW